MLQLSILLIAQRHALRSCERVAVCLLAVLVTHRRYHIIVALAEVILLLLRLLFRGLSLSLVTRTALALTFLRSEKKTDRILTVLGVVGALLLICWLLLLLAITARHLLKSGLEVHKRILLIVKAVLKLHLNSI